LIEGLAFKNEKIEKEVPSDENPDEMVTVTEEIKKFDVDLFEELVGFFEKAFTQPKGPFVGDLENATYKAILAGIREFQPSDHERPQKTE